MIFIKHKNFILLLIACVILAGAIYTFWFYFFHRFLSLDKDNSVTQLNNFKVICGSDRQTTKTIYVEDEASDQVYSLIKGNLTKLHVSSNGVFVGDEGENYLVSSEFCYPLEQIGTKYLYNRDKFLVELDTNKVYKLSPFDQNDELKRGCGSSLWEVCLPQLVNKFTFMEESDDENSKYRTIFKYKDAYYYTLSKINANLEVNEVLKTSTEDVKQYDGIFKYETANTELGENIVMKTYHREEGLCVCLGTNYVNFEKNGKVIKKYRHEGSLMLLGIDTLTKKIVLQDFGSDNTSPKIYFISYKDI